MQLQTPQLSLGFELSPNQIKTQEVQIRTSNLKTLNDFQKLLGDINWLRPYLKLTTGDLKPLFDIAKGESDPKSPRNLTPEACKPIDLVQTAIQEQFITYYDSKIL